MYLPRQDTSNSTYDREFTVVFVGEKGVGKTSLIRRLVLKTFNPNLPTTSGITVWQYVVRKDKQRIRVKIWDTPGHDPMNNFTPNFFRTTDAVVIVVDHTNRQSFLNLDEWRELVLRSVEHSVLLFIAGTKGDVQDQLVNVDELSEFGERNVISNFQTSALTGDGMQRMINYIVDSLVYFSAQRNRGFGLQDSVETANRRSRGWSACCGGRRSPSPALPDPLGPTVTPVAEEAGEEMRVLSAVGARALPNAESDEDLPVSEDLQVAVANLVSALRVASCEDEDSTSMTHDLPAGENAEQSAHSTFGYRDEVPITSSLEPASAAPSTSNTAGDSGASDPAPSRSTAEGDSQSISADSRMDVSFPDSRTESSRPLSSSDPDAAVAGRSSNDRVAPYVSIMTPESC